MVYEPIYPGSVIHSNGLQHQIYHHKKHRNLWTIRQQWGMLRFEEGCLSCWLLVQNDAAENSDIRHLLPSVSAVPMKPMWMVEYNQNMISGQTRSNAQVLLESAWNGIQNYLFSAASFCTRSLAFWQQPGFYHTVLSACENLECIVVRQLMAFLPTSFLRGSLVSNQVFWQASVLHVMLGHLQVEMCRSPDGPYYWWVLVLASIREGKVVMCKNNSLYYAAMDAAR